MIVSELELAKEKIAALEETLQRWALLGRILRANHPASCPCIIGFMLEKTDKVLGRKPA